MKKIEDVVFIIQARTQSTRVPNKMLRPFADSSLFEIAVQKVLSSSVIPKQNFYLSVMDDELIEIAEKYGVNTFIRSEESTQEPVTLQKVLEWYDKLPFKYFVIINGCNPLLKVDTIDKFVQSFLESDSNGMFGVFEKKTFLFNNDGEMINRFFGEDKYLATLETKFVETCYEAAHSLYAGSTSDIGNGIYMGTFKEKGNPNFFVMDEIECFDIDWPWQFEVAEKLYMMKDSI
jgi:CMP-N-acetylneuraminic acid synthetase